MTLRTDLTNRTAEHNIHVEQHNEANQAILDLQDQITTISGGGVADGDKGDIIVSDLGTTWTIQNGVITAAKVASDIATQAELDAEEAARIAALIAHEGAADPHPGYLKEADASGLYQPLDSDLTTVAGLTPSNDDVLQRKAGAWTNRTPAQFKTDLSLVKGDVGLGNVDNTSDTNKPVSTAQQTALDAKAPLASPALTGNPTAPTPSASDDDTSIATTAHVKDVAEQVFVHSGGSYGLTGGRLFIGTEDPEDDGYTLAVGDLWVDTT